MFTFDKTSRLLKKTDYDAVFHQATKKVTAHFVMLYKNNTVGRSRLGLAVSKKIIAKAHDRNRIKRMLRETFRQQALPSVDIVFLVRNGITAVDNLKLHSEISTIWNALCKK